MINFAKIFIFQWRHFKKNADKDVDLYPITMYITGENN